MRKSIYNSPRIEEIYAVDYTVFCASSFAGNTQGFDYDPTEYLELD